MNWLSKKQKEDGTNYWQTIADALAAILLVILLVLMLLILYIIRTPDSKPEEEHTEPTAAAAGWDGGDDRRHRDNDDSSGGGDNDPTEPIPVFTGDDGEEKAAVYVRLLDAETERPILAEDIRFQLYNSYNAQMALHTYYPEKTEFRTFATTEGGTFYLPEKLSLGSYFLREITEPEGYDAADKLELHLDAEYDWPRPYVAEVKLYPARNVIRFQVRDSVTGEPVPGGEYEILADGDIRTKDGTLRFSDGQAAAQVSAGEDGTGETEELYLGRYRIRQAVPPRYYAALSAPVNAFAEKKVPNRAPDAVEILCEKTAMTILVVDALYDQMPIAGAEFTAALADGSTVRLQTDSSGRCTLTDLEKDTEYRLEQTGTRKGWHTSDESITFRVDAEGRINGEVRAEHTLTNRTLRASVSITDALLPGSTAERSAALYSSDGKLQDSWQSSGVAHIAEGLEPGQYELRINDRTAKHFEITDTTALQTVTVSVWTAASLSIAAVLAGMACFGVAAAVLTIRRRKRKEAESYGKQ